MNPLMIKVCGLTSHADLKFCQDMGIDLTGFIFHPPSPRYVEPENVGAWKKKNELRVGVFVELDPSRILEIIDAACLDMVQLHGDHDPHACLRMGPDRIIRTFWPERFISAREFEKELERFRHVCRYYIFDAGRNLGGHGRGIKCPWLKQIRSPRPYFLAGGLGPDNLRDVSWPGMAGIDVNSGVESFPGRKDPEKIRQVVKIVSDNSHYLKRSE